MLAVVLTATVTSQPSPALAATSTTGATFVSQPGDWIGQGATYSFPTVSFTGLRGGYPTFSVSSPTDQFNVWLAAPAGRPLAPGFYPNAQRFDFRAPGTPGLDVFGDGRGCNTVVGSFTVYDATYAADGSPQSFAAEFTLHCEGGQPALYGKLSLNSSVSMPALPLATPTLTGLSLTSGPTAGGTAVTITGSGLGGATEVDFGTTPGTGVSVDATGTQLTVTSPPHAAGTADVTVTTPVGTSNTEAFTYDAPVIANLSPSGGPAAGGTVVTVTGSALNDATAVDFGSVPGTDISVNAAGTELTVTSPPHTAGTADVTVSTAAATSAGVPYDYVTSPTGTIVTGAAFASQPGNWVGQGTTESFPTVTFTGLRGGYPTFSVSNATDLFNVWLAAPAGQPLVPGTYSNAQRFDFRAAGTPGLDVFGDGRGCNTVSGSFTVYDATYNADGSPRSFAAEFTLYCEGSGPALYGRLALDSSASMPPLPVVPAVTGLSPASGPTTGGTRVTLTGTDLGSASAVYFGPSAGAGLSVNGAGTELTVTSPPGAGSVAVTVVMPSGTTSGPSFTYVAPPPPPPPPPSGAPWSQSLQLPPPSETGAVSCATTSWCVMVGGDGSIDVTSDGGASWQNELAPTDVGALYGVSCPAVETCVAVGGGVGPAPSGTAIAVTHDGGAIWTAPTMPAGNRLLSGVSCPTVSHCVAVGVDLQGLSSTVLVSDDGGATWTSEPSSALSSVPMLTSVSCPSATRCVAVGSDTLGGGNAYAVTSDDGGATWVAGALPAEASPGVYGLQSVACGDTTHCMAVGSGRVVVTSDGGATWQDGAGAVPGSDVFNGVWCTSATGCVAVGDLPSGNSSTAVAATTVDLGGTWKASTVAGSSSTMLAGVDCPSAEVCIGVGGDMVSGALLRMADWTSADGGQTWAAGVLPPQPPQPLAVACATAAQCVAVGIDGVLSTGDSGARWTTDTSAAPTDVLFSVTCPSATACVAVGADIADGRSAALVSTDGGVTWTPGTVPAGPVELTGVACSSPSACVAVGSAPGGTSSVVLTSGDGGRTWASAPVPAGVALLDGVACPSATTCMAVGGAVSAGPSAAASLIRSTDGGQSWTVEPLAGDPALASVACPSAEVCTAVGDGYVDEGGVPVPVPVAEVTTDGGQTWTQASPAGGEVGYLATVSCPSTAQCVVGGATTGGRIPVGQVFDAEGITASGVSSWGQQALPSGIREVDGVACPTTTQCVAVGYDEQGGAVLLTGAPSASGGGSNGGGSNGGGGTGGGGGGGPVGGGGTPLPPASPAPTAPPPPAGAVSSDSGVSASGTGTAAASVGGISASAPGAGGVTVATYGSDPEGEPAFGAGGTYFDVKVSSGNSFGSLTIEDCTSVDAAGGPVMRWWDPGSASWQPVSDQHTTAGPPACVTATVTATSSPSLAQLTGTVFGIGDTAATSPGAPSTPPPPVVRSGSPGGYRMVAADGGVFAFGGAGFYGSMGGRPLAQPVVATASTPDGRGYWLVGADGGVFAFGDAGYFGSEPGLPASWRVASPVVALVPTPDGGGYWEVNQAGDVFSFGDAGFFGSMGGRPLAQPVVGMASTPDGRGYWLVGADGGVFGFGDAGYFGSESGLPASWRVASPVVALVPTPDGGGYWEVNRAGDVFSFGDAGFFGSMGGRTLDEPVVAMVPTADGRGYWLVGADGGLFAFGDASFDGSMGGQQLQAPVVSAAAG